MPKKQPNSRMCFVCGIENPIGLKMSFYEDDEGRVLGTWTPGEEHQGYPGVLHGGIAATLLDEVAGRVITNRGLWMATAKLEIRYKQPVPIGRPLTAVGEVVRLRGRALEAHAYIQLEDGSIAVEAEGLYLRLPDEQVEDLADELDFWAVLPDEAPDK